MSQTANDHSGDLILSPAGPGVINQNTQSRVRLTFLPKVELERPQAGEVDHVPEAILLRIAQTAEPSFQDRPPFASGLE
jgi:hypothetical protein